MSESKFKPALMSQEEFSTGRPDKFNGTQVGVYAYPYKGKQSKDGKYWLFIGLLIQPDEDSGYETFFEPYFGGNLSHAVPSKDGISPAGGDDDDFLMLASGKYKGDGLDRPCVDKNGMIEITHENVGEYLLLDGTLSKGGWEQAFLALTELDTKNEFDHSKPGYLGFSNGFRFRYDRVPDTRDKDKTSKEGEDERKILVPTKLLGKSETGAKSSAKKSTTKEASSGTNGTSDDLSDRVKVAIFEYLTETGEKEKKGKVQVEVGKKFDTKERAKVYGLFKTDEFLLDIPGVVVDVDSAERFMSVE